MFSSIGPRWLWSARLLAAAVFASGLAYLPYRVLDGPSADQLVELERERDRVRADIDELARENADLRRDIAALKEDPRAIEDIARDGLGMVFPGELVIRVEAASR